MVGKIIAAESHFFAFGNAYVSGGYTVINGMKIHDINATRSLKGILMRISHIELPIR